MTRTTSFVFALCAMISITPMRSSVFGVWSLLFMDAIELPRFASNPFEAGLLVSGITAAIRHSNKKVGPASTRAAIKSQEIEQRRNYGQGNQTDCNICQLFDGGAVEYTHIPYTRLNEPERERD